MKKLVLLIILCLPIFLSAQTRKPFAGNWDFIGNNKFSKDVKFDTVNLSSGDIRNFKNTYEVVADSVDIDSLVYLKSEVYTKDETDILLGTKANVNLPSFTGGLMGFTANATYPGTLYIGNAGGSLTHASGDEGYYNTAFGIGNQQINSSGYSNTSLGYEALRYNSTGASNTAIGRDVLRGNQSSNHNTAMGYNAGAALTSGSGFNTFIGSSAGAYSQTGDDLVAVGAYAGRGGTATTKNTSVGNYALFTGGGSYNVALGFQAGYYETGSNYLYIDNQKRTDQADARIKALIVGIFNANTSSQQVTLNAAIIYFPYLPTYADNAAAIAGGLTAGRVYKTSSGVLMIVY